MSRPNEAATQAASQVTSQAASQAASSSDSSTGSAYAVRRPIENSYLVRERDRRRVRELALVVVVLAPVVLGVLLNIWIQIEVVGTGYRVHELERGVHALREYENQLRVEASYLASPARVEGRAIRGLGMSFASIDQLVFAEELR